MALDKVFSHLNQFKSALKEPKCALFLISVAFLGYVVLDKGVSVQAGKIKSVKEWPQPHNITKFQQFLGLCNYYRHFFHQYAAVAALLVDILQQKGSYNFSLEWERAFQK